MEVSKCSGWIKNYGRGAEKYRDLFNLKREDKEMNRVQYVKEIAQGNAEYKVTVNELLEHIETFGKNSALIKALHEIKTENDMYDVAHDWSIPVIMVKFLKKRF